eukprot:807976_1
MSDYVATTYAPAHIAQLVPVDSVVPPEFWAEGVPMRINRRERKVEIVADSRLRSPSVPLQSGLRASIPTPNAVIQSRKRRKSLSSAPLFNYIPGEVAATSPSLGEYVGSPNTLTTRSSSLSDASTSTAPSVPLQDYENLQRQNEEFRAKIMQLENQVEKLKIASTTPAIPLPLPTADFPDFNLRTSDQQDFGFLDPMSLLLSPTLSGPISFLDNSDVDRQLGLLA